MGIVKVGAKLVRKFCFAVVGFFIGLICSLLFYEFVLSETDFDDTYKVLMFISSAIFLSLGFSFSRQVKNYNHDG